MAISIDHSTLVITVPKADTTLDDIGPPEIRSLDIDQFRKDLNAIQASENGMPLETTHIHTAPSTLGGVTYGRRVEIINGYTITFEAGTYAVTFTGADNNIGDVTNYNSTQTRSTNSAGVQQITSGFWTDNLTEDYPVDGQSAMTPAQALYGILQALTEFERSGTTISIKERDAITEAFELTLDSATAPTTSTQSG